MNSHMPARSLDNADVEKLLSVAVDYGFILKRDSILGHFHGYTCLHATTARALAALFPASRQKELIAHLCRQAGLSEILTTESLDEIQKSLQLSLCGFLSRLHPSGVRTEVLTDWIEQYQAQVSSSGCADGEMPVGIAIPAGKESVTAQASSRESLG